MTRPRIFAVAGHRYEPQWLVDEMRENLAPVVDEVVVVDDRARTDELWVNESKYRLMQRVALMEAGIRPWDWCWITSPDERLATGAGPVFRRLASRRQRAIYEFPLREMFSLTRYRVDGMWGNKWRPRLFPFLPGQKFTKRKIQTAPTPVGRYRRIRVPEVPIYHLENVAPASRVERSIVYEALSPGSRERAAQSPYWAKHDPYNRYIRRYGFAYLADTRGMRLRPVPKGHILPVPTKPYLFRVPDELLVAECGRTRAQLERWLTTTLRDR